MVTAAISFASLTVLIVLLNRILKPTNKGIQRTYNNVTLPVTVLTILYYAYYLGTSVGKLDYVEFGVRTFLVLTVLVMLFSLGKLFEMRDAKQYVAVGATTSALLIACLGYSIIFDDKEGGAVASQTNKPPTQNQSMTEEEQKTLASIVEGVSTEEYKKHCETEQSKYYSVCYDSFDEYIKTMYTGINEGEALEYYTYKKKEYAYISEHEIESTKQKIAFLSELKGVLSPDKESQTLEKVKLDYDTLGKSLEKSQRYAEELVTTLQQLEEMAVQSYNYMNLVGWAEGEKYEPKEYAVPEFDNMQEFSIQTYINMYTASIETTEPTLEWVQKYLAKVQPSKEAQTNTEEKATNTDAKEPPTNTDAKKTKDE